MDAGLTERLERLLQQSGVSQDVVNDLLAALVISQAEKLARVEEAGRHRTKLLDEILVEVRSMKEHQLQHPSLLWLARYRTKETVTVFVLTFVLLSVWYVSGFRQPLLELLGLPVF